MLLMHLSEHIANLRDHLQYTDLDTQRVLRGDLDNSTNEGLVVSLLDEMVIAYPGKPS